VLFESGINDQRVQPREALIEAIAQQLLDFRA
jgi:hypothetical protein